MSSAAENAKKKKKKKAKAPRVLLGKRVAVDRQGVVHKGVVKFHDTTEFHEGVWVGVALDKPNGINDGYVVRKQWHGGVRVAFAVRCTPFLPLRASPPLDLHLRR